MHKHMQVIPYESMACDGIQTFVPVEQTALRYVKENNINTPMFTLPQFSKFKHIFHKIDPDFMQKTLESEDGAEEMSEILES